jgi:hypothetical protein
MKRRDSQADPGRAVDHERAVDDDRADGTAVRDAVAIAARAAADESAADVARDRYRTERIAALEPDARIAPLLFPGERLLAVRCSVVCDRESGPGGKAAGRVAGDLYVTARRLILLGRPAISFDLDDIEESGYSGERLLLVMRDGTGISLDVAQPRLLRVEIGTARADARS